MYIGFFFGNPPLVEFELACLLALFLGVDLFASLSLLGTPLD